jgi:hypothetical protein
MNKSVYIASMLLLALPFGLSSCLGTKYNYSFKLLGENAKTDKTFDDGKIQAFFTVGDKQLDFTLKNLTADPMKINWDEASLIIYGESKRVMHKGVKYIDRNSPQAPTVIPSNSSINDLVLPTDNVYYKEGSHSTYYSSAGSWKINDLLLSRDRNKEETKQLIMNSKGQTLKFFLPIEQNSQKINYTFEFQITDVTPEAKS